MTGATCSSRGPVLSICTTITEESQTLGDQLDGGVGAATEHIGVNPESPVLCLLLIKILFHSKQQSSGDTTVTHSLNPI